MANRIEIGTPGSMVDRTSQVHLLSTISLERSLNEVGRATFTFIPGYRPSLLNHVAIYQEDGVTLLFTGLIIGRSVKGEYPQSTFGMMSVECSDYGVYLSWYYIDLAYTAPTTLGVVLTAIQAALPAGYGITLATGMGALSDVLEPFTWTTVRVSDALREVAGITGRAYVVSVDRKLSLLSLPTGTAPESFTDADPNSLSFSWADPSDVPANMVILSCGPTGSAYHTYAWTANGSASSWQMDIPASGPGVSRTLLLVIGGNNVYATVDEGGVDGWFAWNWATRTISINSANYPLTEPIPNGTAMSFEYLAQYPFSVAVPVSPPTTPIVALFKDESVTEYARGVSIAEGIYAQLSASPREVVAVSTVHGWYPGQSLSIDFDEYGIPTIVAAVKRVEVVSEPDLRWRYTVHAVESSTYNGSYLDQWRALTGSSSGVAVLGGGSGGGGTTVISAGSAHLGGSRTEMVLASAWTPIIHYQTYRCAATGSYVFRVEAKTDNAGTSVTVRLWDVTAGAVVAGGTTTASTATGWTTTTLTVALILDHLYEAEVIGSNTTYGVLVGQATIEPQ